MLDLPRRARTFSPLFSLAALSLTALALTSAPARAENPHDGYAFWLPNGVLKVGDAASEKGFHFERTAGRDTFTVPLRKTRFDVPRGDLYVIPVGSTFGTFVVPRGSEDVKELSVTVALPAGTRAPSAYRLYLSDDASAWPNVLGPGGPAAYGAGINAFFKGDLVNARKDFQQAATGAKTPAQARYARRFIRWCDAEARFPKIAKGDAKSYYNLGLYGMVNGFWELAQKSFEASTEANPKNPDAWYMLGDAASYVLSDLDTGYKKVYPYYKKAADLYPHANANTFRNHLGLFKKLKVQDGKGGTTVLTLTPEQIAETKDKWEFCTAVFDAASRGSIRMENHWVEYDQEFDNSAPLEHDPAPYEGLWEPGTIDTFMKFTGWGASDAIGADCGANRSADVNIGMREWDVLYHEWNHTLDWLMAFSGEGIGVPETHSSDWCGFQPISSMGMGHHSCNRYYMTPGMYRAIHGSDKPTTPWISEWLISDPVALPNEGQPSEKVMNALRDDTKTVAYPLSPQNVPDAGGTKWALATAQDGYVDLQSIEREAPRDAYSFAHVYVWSPADMKVRCWYGADDNARIWVNNRLVYTGNYWSVCKFEEAQEKDQIAFSMPLRRGWNSVLMQVSNVTRVEPSDHPPHPFWYGRPDRWGFSMRLCDFHNEPIPGMRWQASRPPMFDAKLLAPAWTPATSGKAQPRPPLYSWAKVKDDYTMDLPHLTLADLRAITGYKDLTVTNEMLFDPGQPVSVGPASLFHTGKADPNEVALNNELNWFFSPKEMIATLRYKDAQGAVRDLVFLRPEMYESFFALARVAPEARARGIKSQADRVAGYFTVPRGDSPNGRIVLVVDTFLGNNPPVDEEDLLGTGA